MSQTIKLGQATKIGIGSLLILITGVGITSKVITNILVGSVDWVTHTYEVELKLTAIEKALVDAETGQRGFLYTGYDNYLAPYNNSRSVQSKEFAALKSLIKDNPRQVEREKLVEDLAEQKMAELAQTISLKKAGKEKDVRALVFSGKGKQVMDKLRQQVKEMIDVENELLIKRKSDAKHAELISSIVSLGGTFSALALGLITLTFINRKIVRPINEVTNSIVISSTEIAATVEQQERTAAQQAISVNETTTTMDELGASARNCALQAEAAATAATQVLALIDNRSHADADRDVSLRTKVVQITEQILRLSEQIQQIGSISTLVSGLANQTNMLALNAAVEAVRAGEHGKGFGVVAAEIRKLADESKKSAERINTLVTDIHSSTNSTVMLSDEGRKTVEIVVNAVNNIAFNIQQISLTAKQQDVATQQVVGAMNALNQGASQTASGITQTKVGTQKLNDAANTLKAVV